MRLSLWALTVAAQVTAGVPPIDRFQAEIERYLAVRRGILTEVSGPSPNSSAQQLTDASDALAAAIRRARPNARPGDIFTDPVAAELKRRIADSVRAANLAPVLAGIDDEKPSADRPSVHLRFPGASPLASMPPSLLAVLPPLPKELEYRIIGTYLVLRDIDAALILDFIPAAVPR